MLRIFGTIAACAIATSAAAQITSEQRTGLLSFYPCAASLTDEELLYLVDWANATKTDPCMLSAQDFTTTFAQSTPNANDTAVQALEVFFTENKAKLFAMQVLLFGRDDADGLWGPMTQARLSELLETYHAIGGIDEDWGVRSVADVPRFIDWVVAAEYAIAVGGEFPD